MDTKKYGIFITSAINAKFSVYKPEERLEQTLATIASVKARVPNAVICMTDCGIPGLSDELRARLTAEVDHFVDFSGDKTVNSIHDTQTVQDIVKNLTEMVVVSKFMKLAVQHGWFNDCDRVFKVSGRYELTDRFRLSDYESEELIGKYVLSKRMLIHFEHGITGVAQQYMLRVYSMDTALLPEFIDLLQQMIKHMQERVAAGGYIDIEHLFYKFLPRDKVVEFARTGVKGNIAPNGQPIEN